MSWETFVVGTIKFKKNISIKERKKLVSKIKEELELFPSPYEAYEEHYEGDEFLFQHANWSSHLDREKIENLFKKIKSKVDYFAVDLFYLDPDYGETIYFNREEKTMRIKGENNELEVSLK
jgi:hypothetical protein